MTNKGQMDLPFVSFCKNVWSQSKRLDEVFDKDDANGWIYIYTQTILIKYEALRNRFY